MTYFLLDLILNVFIFGHITVSLHCHSLSVVCICSICEVPHHCCDVIWWYIDKTDN